MTPPASSRQTMGENMIQYLAEGKQSQTLERKEKRFNQSSGAKSKNVEKTNS